MILDAIGIGLVVAGVFFQVVAAVGLVRFRDLYSRLHVVCITDTLGVPLVMTGVALHVGPSLTAGKLLLAIAFLFLTSPLVGHLLSRAALESGLEPWDGAGRPAPARRGKARR